jgi:hypothetical protein
MTTTKEIVSFSFCELSGSRRRWMRWIYRQLAMLPVGPPKKAIKKACRLASDLGLDGLGCKVQIKNTVRDGISRLRR